MPSNCYGPGLTDETGVLQVKGPRVQTWPPGLPSTSTANGLRVDPNKGLWAPPTGLRVQEAKYSAEQINNQNFPGGNWYRHGQGSIKLDNPATLPLTAIVWIRINGWATAQNDQVRNVLVCVGTNANPAGSTPPYEKIDATRLRNAPTNAQWDFGFSTTWPYTTVIPAGGSTTVYWNIAYLPDTSRQGLYAAWNSNAVALLFHADIAGTAVFGNGRHGDPQAQDEAA
jgi:hypothetical protein